MSARPVKLTVGIPTYNRPQWLKESIASVLGQSYADFRLIVSDNASEDDTADVVRSFDDDRVHYSRSPRNVGSIGNFNRLIGLADTEFLVLLPDDDLLLPGHLEATVEVLERFQRVGLVHSAFRFVDAQSRFMHTVTPIATRSPVQVDGRDRALEFMMVSTWGICFPSVAYRTKAIVDAGGLREREEPFGDRQMWMRIGLDWDFAYIRTPLAGIRTHDATVTRSIGTDRAVTSDAREVTRAFSRVNYERRIAFLADAPLDSGSTRRLRALATLQLLIETATSLRQREVAARLANVVRMYPRVVLRSAPWRLVIAQLGGRRALAALRRAASHA